MTRSSQRMTWLLVSVITSVFLSCAVLLVVEAYSAEPAEAHRLGHYAVRGGNIRYNSGSDFDFINARDWSVSQWNRLKIPIARDTSNTDLDLQFRQYPGDDGLYAYADAYYDWRPEDVDKILYNTRRFRNGSLTEYEREAVAVHEL